MTTKLNQKDLRQHFIRTLYDTLDGVISPTPYLEITQGDNVDIKFLDGKGRLPMPNTTEVTVLDIDIASLFFDDFHILYEGVTGVGKTYTRSNKNKDLTDLIETRVTQVIRRHINQNHLENSIEVRKSISRYHRLVSTKNIDGIYIDLYAK